MANVQFIISSHGISKRFRINNEPPRDSFQEIDEILLPVVKQELRKFESINECSYTNDILLSGKLKELHNDTCHISVGDSCIDASIEHSAQKYPLVRVYYETKGDFYISKESNKKMVVEQTCKLVNDQSSRDLKKSNTICFNTIDYQTRLDTASTLSEPHNYKSLKKEEAKFSVDTVEKEISNVLNEILNNLKEYTRLKDISVEKNTNLPPCEDKLINEFPKYELKSIQQEECKTTISEKFHNSTEFQNGGICLEGSNKNILSKKSDETSESLKLNKCGHVLKGTMKDCNYCEHTVEIAQNLEYRVANVQIVEDSKLENAEKSQIKFKQYSDDYKMFSNVIQNARNKVEPRKRRSQPSISMTRENAHQLRKNQNTFKHLGDCSRTLKEKNHKSKLRTVLYDLEELDEFLSFCEEELKYMMCHFSAATEVLRFLSLEVESVEVILENARYKDVFTDQNGKVTDDYFQNAVKTYDKFRKQGTCLLTDIIEQGKIWRHAVDAYKIDLDKVLDTVCQFCSISIEDELFYNHDLVYTICADLHQQVFQAHIIQNKVQDLHSTEYTKIWDIRERIEKFNRMNNKITYLVGKYIL